MLYKVDSSKVEGQVRIKTRMMDDNSKSKEGVVIEDVELTTKEQDAPNKTQTNLCPSMLIIVQFLKEDGNNEHEE